MKVRWLPGASDDLREIRDYIAEDNPTAARAMAAHFYTAEVRIEAPAGG
jgi:plasmid stabilization system protein ParE